MALSPTITTSSTNNDDDTKELLKLLKLLGNNSKSPKLVSAIRSLLLEFDLSSEALRDSWEAYAINLVRMGDTDDSFSLGHLDQFRSYLKVNASVKVNVNGDFHNHKRDLDALDHAYTPNKKPHTVDTANSRSGAGAGADIFSPLTTASTTASTPRVSMSPPVTTVSYNSRLDSGKVVLEYNKTMLHCRNNDKNDNAIDIQFSDLNVREREFLVPCVNLAKIVNSEKERIEELGEAMLDRADLMYTQCNIPSTGTVATYGRVCNEATSGALNKASAILEGHTGARVKLDFNGIASIPPLFPGQVIAVQGQNPTGRIFHVEKIWDGIDGKVAPQSVPVDDLSIIVAVGPFTDEGLDFAPLGDLLNGEVALFEPKVLILMGPFCSTDTVLELEDGEKLQVDIENLFAQKISVALDEALEKCPNTKIILVPSVDDPLGPQIFPQPPFKTRKSGKSAHDLLKTEGLEYAMKLGDLGLPKSDRLHITSNPSTFSIIKKNPLTPEVSSFTVSLTSIDMIRWINKDVIRGYTTATDRIVNVIESGIVSQRSMYPLRTTEATGNVPVDFSDYSKFSLSHDALPDLLIIPSVVRTALCTVLKGGTILLNPGYLLRSGKGGTYAKISISEGKVKADVVKI